MTILDHIVAYKKKEIAAKKEAYPIKLFEGSIHFNRTVNSMAAAIKNSDSGIIAEHKRRSPSKSVINEKADLPDVISGYEKAGVSAISVLTDTRFFGGSIDDLLLARKTVSLPLLRKEFIIDSYQLFEARAAGADAVLLIAAILTREQLSNLAKVAKNLQLEVLLEVHNEEELSKSPLEDIDLLGVNNRDLKTFDVSTDISKKLASQIPSHLVKVSESGLSRPETILELREYGYSGFLMGEHFMRELNPGRSASEFIKNLRS